MNKSEQFARLTCSRYLSEKLVAAGIIPWAVLWHMVGDDGSENAKEEWGIHWNDMFPAENGEGDYSPGLCIPAWTKEELDVLIGPKFPKAGLVETRLLSRQQDPNGHSVYLSARRFDSAKGADCAAMELGFLLESKELKAEEANKRFLDVFQLVEKRIINLSLHPKFPL